MVRLQVVLDPAEAEALATWAASELRDPRDPRHSVGWHSGPRQPPALHVCPRAVLNRLGQVRGLDGL
jgi:hypothetical protein